MRKRARSILRLLRRLFRRLLILTLLFALYRWWPLEAVLKTARYSCECDANQRPFIFAFVVAFGIDLVALALINRLVTAYHLFPCCLDSRFMFCAERHVFLMDQSRSCARSLRSLCHITLEWAPLCVGSDCSLRSLCHGGMRSPHRPQRIAPFHACLYMASGFERM